MTIGKWKTRLKKLCKDAGTYDKKLDPNTKEGKKAIGIIVGVFIGILAFAEYSSLC